MDEEFDTYGSSDNDHMIWCNFYIISFPICSDNIRIKKKNLHNKNFFIDAISEIRIFLHQSIIIKWLVKITDKIVEG